MLGSYYLQQQEKLGQQFQELVLAPAASLHPDLGQACQSLEELPLRWVPRVRPRKFGKLLDGDVQACKQVHGV